MTLAGKLDRLRGRRVGGEPHQAAQLGDSLRRLRPLRAAAASGAPCAEQLAERLQMRLCNGVLIADRAQQLPHEADSLSDLANLPGATQQPSPDWVYIDTETTGLSGGVGNLAFMLGVARWCAGVLQVRQYLLSSFAAESNMLSDAIDWIGETPLLVSFNGKSFDMPLLLGRLRLHRIAHRLATAPHLDLVHPLRRAFRKQWADCRLQTAEQRLLGIDRHDDLPGSQAPAAWRQWLQLGEHAMLTRALLHNHQDVVSLALLQHKLATVFGGDPRIDCDHASVGQAWFDRGDLFRAHQVWSRTRDRLDADGLLGLAALHRRLGDWAAASDIWQQLCRAGNAQAACELSKYYEHRCRDYRLAIDFAGQCTTQERTVRVTRLMRKIGIQRELPL